MRTLFSIVGAVGFLIGCAAKTTTSAPTFSQDDWSLMSFESLYAPQVQTNLAGRWIRVGNDAQYPRVAAREPSCEKGLSFMVIAQQGNYVRMKLYERLPRMAYDEYELVTNGEESGGWIQGDHLVLRGEATLYHDWGADDYEDLSRAVLYDLRIELIAQMGHPDIMRPHLVGTKDDMPIRLAPLTLRGGDTDCGKREPPP